MIEVPTMSLQPLQVNEFRSGNLGHNESAVWFFRRGKECSPPPLAEIGDLQIAQLQA
jgi:hypothetical protein